MEFTKWVYLMMSGIFVFAFVILLVFGMELTWSVKNNKR
ncbi:hypothetical protein SShM2_046 [Synechococcus phage S-ShM2]|uniref:Uncharacterized protein n=1 Tax=Synechococcus phage S-ShM2 TaxID=445683 RepID=E3SJU7_9CAUD|nr:hypothetical protein SShM2_046 [Synechococcus phage S-ShM2]ADO97657.1 hypothetical protein SShM2_046 [Synechococcus phage S-ShM2]